MKHIIHGVHTQETKVNVLSNLDEESAWVAGDWMMKIPPQQCTEKMEDWFGKRGISGHVHWFLMPNSEGLKKATYFTFLDRCSQDIFTTACVNENDFIQFKKDFPDVKIINCHNDNASCYAGASAVTVKHETAEKLGLKLAAVDFNEAQKGKDQCDRDGAVAKRAIQSYVNEGNDVLNAIEIKMALDKSVGSLRNSKTSVISVDASGGHMEKAKIQNISRHHYFKPKETGYRAWEFPGIGPEKLTPYQPQEKGRNVTTKIFCSDTECVEVFDHERDLEIHLNLGKYSYTYQTDKRHSTNDKVKILLPVN